MPRGPRASASGAVGRADAPYDALNRVRESGEGVDEIHRRWRAAHASGDAPEIEFARGSEGLLPEYDVIVVGAGLSGCTIAERCSRALGMKVLTLERRAHAGGNCYDYVDARSGIRCSKYGAHLFHTKHARVWEYVTRFSEWVPFDHRVLGRVTRTSASEEGKRARVLVPIPPTRATVNALFDDADVRGEEDMEAW